MVSALKKGGFDIPIFSVSVAENSEHGDYATNAALIVAKTVKENPMDVAERIKNSLVESSGTFFEKIDCARPGFINFWLSRDVVLDGLREILTQKNEYGKVAPTQEKIQVEFISANPTGPLTLANARGGFYGDTLSRVLERAGFFVEREYYINDAGNQIRTLGCAVCAAIGEVPMEEGYYRGEHITEWAEANREMIQKNKEDPELIGRACAQYFLDTMIRPAVEQKMKIRFGRWTSEYDDIREKGFVEQARTFFEKKDLSYEKDGAVWLRTTDFGDDKDRVLVTGDGFPTYFLVDAAHYLQTNELGYGRKINILGADHHGYVSRIQAVARIFEFKKSDVLILQLVRLVAGGKEVRMSKRKGTFVTIDELLEEVPVDVARYFFLEKSLDTHMDFDLDRAREQSAKNPVYYIQYAHARTASIFRKVRYSGEGTHVGLLKESEELAVIKKLMQFPEIIADAARDYQLSRITRYVHEVAHVFHNFYEKHQVIIEGDSDRTSARLALVRGTQIILKQSLDLLGITAPEEM